MRKLRIVWPVILILLLTGLLIMSGCKPNIPKQSLQNVENLDTLQAEQPAPDTAGIVKDNYKLTNYDTPPVPVVNKMPVYPDEYRKSGIQGVVLLEVDISATGQVTDAKVLKSLMPESGGLDDVAISTVKTWKFKPALLQKKPVPSKVEIPIPFSLK